MKRLLLVEDQHPFITQEILQAYGDLEIVTGKRGDKAIELFAAGNFDGVLLDLRLPVLDGFTVLQAIKKIDPETPVVILSAYHDKESRERATRLGAAAYFVKPPDYQKVHRKLIGLMALRRRDRLTQTIQLDVSQPEILAKYRRLIKLKEQAAHHGVDAPPEIKIEIEDLEAELEDFRRRRGSD